MATVHDICLGALRLINVLDFAEEAEPESIAVALDAYNGMMAEEVRAGWLASFSEQTLTDTVPLGAAYTEAAKAAVAVRVAEGFERPVGVRVASQAAHFHAMLASDYWSANKHGVERGVWDYRAGRVS